MNREHHQDIYDFIPRSHSVERFGFYTEHGLIYGALIKRIRI